MGARIYFPKVKEAREALREKALELYQQYDAAIKKAIADDKLDLALPAMQWLMEHMPDEDGTKMLESSIDKQAPAAGLAGPQINIGFSLGGVKASNALPALPTIVEVVDAPTPRRAADIAAPLEVEADE